MMACASLMYELRKITCEIGTIKVSSSIASSKRSVGTVIPSSVLTMCTRAPYWRCASQKYMTEGKFTRLPVQHVEVMFQIEYLLQSAVTAFVAGDPAAMVTELDRAGI